MWNKFKYYFKSLFYFIFLFLIYELFIHYPLLDNNVDYRKNDSSLEQTILPTESTPKDNFQIYFIDVGQADCILIQNNGEYSLIDAGNYLDGKKLIKYFHSLGIEHFQYVIGTHAHEDHIGGMSQIINNFSIDHFYMPDVVSDIKSFSNIIRALEKKGMKFETLEIDSSFTMANTKFLVLWISNHEEDLNDTSIVLKILYGHTSYLLTGDATSNVERQILDKDLKSDLLKVGHHGSKYSSSAQFLKKVSPKYAVISVLKDNEYGFPHQVVLDKLKYLNVSIYRTDLDGTIIASSDGDNIYFDKVHTDTNVIQKNP